MAKHFLNKYDPITVIIPVYNQERLIGKCLKSIKNQNYPLEKIKIIVIDDGSNDKSLDIASKYNVKIIHQNHLGPGAARNQGINEATTDIIAFLDSDDMAYKSWIKEAISYLKSHEKDNIAAVGSSHTLLNNKNNFIKIAWLEHSFRHKKLPEKVNHLGTSGSMYKKSVIRETGGFDNKLYAAEDMDLSSRTLKLGYSLHLIKKPLIKVAYSEGLISYLKKQIINIKYMVVFYVKPSSIKTGKGSYSGFTEYIQGLLPIIFVISTIILGYRTILFTFILWLLALLLLNMPFLIFIKNQKTNAKLNKFWGFFILAYFLARSIAWCIGLFYGLFLVGKKAFHIC